MRAIILYFRFFVLFAICSCSGTVATKEIAVVGDTLRMCHSSLLQIVDYDGYCIVDVKNPWKKNALLHSYMLLHKDSCDVPLSREMTVIRTPINNQLVFATLHAQLIIMLGRADAIAGVCDARYMSIPEIKNGLVAGKIVDCGSSMDVNLEYLMSLSPDAIWFVPFKNGGYGKLDKSGIPLIECVDYMEASPLGCAEWIRFYGRLLGVADKADSLFSVVCSNYERMKNIAVSCSYKPKLMCELKTGSAWYMPGGCSTMGQLYGDAGADYVFGDNDYSGSVPYSFETILARADSVDVWLFKYGADEDKTYISLKDDFYGYTLLRPYKEKRIYACNVSKRRFYEETPFRPDILLEELVMLLHPELDDGYEFKYYEKLQ